METQKIITLCCGMELEIAVIKNVFDRKVPIVKCCPFCGSAYIEHEFKLKEVKIDG